MRKASIIALGLLVSACSPKVEHLGKHLSDEALSHVKVGDSQDQVMRALGMPTAQVALLRNEWLYMYKITEGFAFLDPNVLEQGIVRVRFDAMGRVSAIDRLSGAGDAVQPIDAVTPSVGDDRTVLQQVFGNYGRSAKKERDDEYAQRQRK